MSADVRKDRKSETWIITRTDSEGFSRQVYLTMSEMIEVAKQINNILKNVK